MPTITVCPSGVAESLIPARALPLYFVMTDYQTVGDLKDLIHLRFPKMTFERQRLTLNNPENVLDDHMSIRTLGDATVYLEDMPEHGTAEPAPHSSWKDWFLTAYSGPLFFHQLFYHFPQLSRSHKPWVKSQMQVMAYTLITLHFIKREYETKQLHRFSRPTNSAWSIYEGSFQNWCIAGVVLAAFLYGPENAKVEGTLQGNPMWLYSCSALWLFAEISNYKTHVILRNLRPKGTTKRGIPYGYGFDWGISCPNHTFEILSWVAINALTCNWLITLTWTIQLIIQSGFRAYKKHNIYKLEYGSAYPRRWALLPYVL